MAMRKRDDDLVFPNAAGIDVGGSSHWVAVPRHSCDDPVREFGAMTDDLNAMADWLIACGVDTVALESTGVYWIPVYEVLQQRGLKVFLVDARQMKYVPGRKSDVQDCQWLQRLMSQGYLRAAFRPGEQVCVVRAVARQRPTGSASISRASTGWGWRPAAIIEPLRGRPQPEPLRQRQALLFPAGPVSGHEDQRWQGAVGQDQALGQPGAR